MSCTKVGLFKVSISFETLYYTQYQSGVCTTSKASYKHMYMHDIHIFIIIILTNKQDSWFLSHLLIAGCDIGVQISVRPYVRSSVRSSVRPSTFTSKFIFLDIRDSCESETLHSNCP